MARKLEVEIVGDSRSLERAFDRSAKSATGFNREMAGAEQSLVRVGAARGKALGGIRLAGIGLGAGVAISTATRSVAELRDGLKVSGEEAETFTGRLRNMGAAILGGDLVGTFRAMTKETQSFTQAQVEAIAVLPEAIELIERMGNTSALTAAAIASVPAIAETPVALQLGAARAATTRRTSDDVTQLDLQIAQKTEALARLKQIRAIEGASVAVDLAIIKVLQDRKALAEQQAKLIAGITDWREVAAKEQRQQEAIQKRTTARRDRRLAGFFGRTDRRVFREVEGQPLRAQAAALGSIAEQIRGQIAITKGVERRAQLEDRLIAVLRQQQAVYAAIREEIEAANELLQERADAIKSGILERLSQKRTDVLNKRALADAQEALRLAKLIGTRGAITTARRGVQDVQWEMLQARIERAPASLTAGGVFTLGGVLTININGVTDPEEVARRVAAIIRRRSQQSPRQRRGTQAGTAG